MQVQTTACATSHADEDHEGYDAFLVALRARFDDVTSGGPPLFTTDAALLYNDFLDGLPPARRQHYTCNACQRFIDRFGGLVTVATDGSTVPVMWDADTVPSFFRHAVATMRRVVARARITSVFLAEEKTWGLPNNVSQKSPTGQWQHMAVMPSEALVFKPTPLVTAYQAAAEKGQDFITLVRGLCDFPLTVVKQAHALLTSGNLYRSEKCIGVAKWLLDLHEARAATQDTRARANLTWVAVATAPAGFCHVRSTMIGTLLEDIQAGLSFEQIKRRFDEKMNPTQYQRPTALPSDGNVAQAEKIVAALKSAGALDRRFARIEDVEALWKPKPIEPDAEKPGGVFSHLKTKKAGESVREIEQPPVVMTWEKFQRTVLPEAEQIDFLVPVNRASYVAMVTAVNPDSPPILQWDREEKRNPVSWYLYTNGSAPSVWGLTGGSHVRVTAVTLQPSMWGGGFAHQGEKVFFLLDGARDLHHKVGGGLFPETLRSEYHAVRKTMEAHANGAQIVDADKATACGISLQKGSTWDYVFRVTSKGVKTSYKLDRWD